MSYIKDESLVPELFAGQLSKDTENDCILLSNTLVARKWQNIQYLLAADGVPSVVATIDVVLT